MTYEHYYRIGLVVACSVSAFSSDLVLHDAYSLRRPGLDALLLDHHYRTVDRSNAWIGAWPAPVLERQIAPVDTQAWLRYDDTVQQRRALLHPLLGLSYRNGLTGTTTTSGKRTDLEATVVEGGGFLHAEAPDFHAWGDARISVERQEPLPHSYDGQFFEPSKEGDNSIATFTSFARFEGRMTIDTRLGRFGAGRTRQQWGPTYQYPLVLGQETQPYSHVDWTMEWGDFRLRTLWGQLAIDGMGRFRSDTATRSLYAHRYEWTPSRWLSLGVTEALILYKTQEPIAFVPIVPLFMMKGQSVEDYANGELAFDANLRPLDGWRLYGEFLIDDMSEPASLFNDFWKNKWAFTVGSHVALEPLPELETGLVTEISRVEPWVYTEYVPRSNQAMHQGLPLGNQNGPNSLSIGATSYFMYKDFSFSAGVQWIRKGSDSGSFTTDVRPSESKARKVFLAEPKDHIVTSMSLSYTFLRRAEVMLESSFAQSDELNKSTRQRAIFRTGVTTWL
jgi:hypothetical protein